MSIEVILPPPIQVTVNDQQPGPPGVGIPPGGIEGQRVAKGSGTLAVWVDPELPADGTPGQILVKGEESVSWEDQEKELPTDGTPGQILVKGEESVSWEDPELPADGTPGQILVKGEESVAWEDSVKTINKIGMFLGISGAITSQTENSITDNTQNWVPGAFVDLVAKLESGVVSEYAIILDNTADTLIFDDLLMDPADSYSIIDSVVITPEDVNSLVALDIRSACCAVILPVSTPEIERSYVHSYIERATDGLYKAPIMCRGTQRQAGQKYGTLEHQLEGVRLYAHQWITPHWDIIQTYNIGRIASAYWDNPQSVASASWAPVPGMLPLIMKRFAIEDDWAEYLSLLPRTFLVTFTAHINKTGGVGEIDIAIAKRDAAGNITFLDTIYVSTRLGSGIGIVTLTVTAPVALSYRESFIGIARNSGGTFSITEGSSLIAQEI